MRSGNRVRIRLLGMKGDPRVLGLVRLGDMVRSVLIFSWQIGSDPRILTGVGQALRCPWMAPGEGVILAQTWCSTGTLSWPLSNGSLIQSSQHH